MILSCNGKIGSGKSTFSEMIKKLDKRFEEKSFAFKLKQIVALITGTNIEENLSQEGKKTVIPEFGKSLGEIQQIIGTEVMRNNFDSDVWVKSLFMDYKPERDFWIISDVRFINEVNYIKNMGGIVIRLEGDPSKTRENSNRDLNHISETELDSYDGFDFVFKNEGSIEDLWAFAEMIVERVGINANLK